MGTDEADTVGLPSVDDLLVGADWSCMSSPAGAQSGPDDLGGTDLHWLTATVPGTVADALRQVGASEPQPERLDGRDWWYRCRFAGPGRAGAVPTSPDGWVLSLEGLATMADVLPAIGVKRRAANVAMLT